MNDLVDNPVDSGELKRLAWQTICSESTVVATVRRASGQWETIVMGGDLDGWHVRAESKREARETHKWVVWMVKGSGTRLSA